MLDDCSIGTKGTIEIMNAIKDSHSQLKQISLECNGIGTSANYYIDRALQTKNNSLSINLDENPINQPDAKTKKSVCLVSLQSTAQTQMTNHTSRSAKKNINVQNVNIHRTINQI